MERELRINVHATGCLVSESDMFTNFCKAGPGSREGIVPTRFATAGSGV